MGRQFNWLWSAYAVSTLGTFLAFNAFSLILIKVLHSGPAQVAALSASGTLVGALVALPLGPWVEFRRKRPVMITMDLVRFVVLLTIPVAYALGELTFAQLLVVSIVTGAADLTFTAASGAHLRTLVAREDLMVANGRFESTQWTATVLGMPLGGAAIGLFGPVVTIVADAVSYLLSALGIRAIGGGEADPPAREGATGLRTRDLVEGWRHILKSPALRPLYFNSRCPPSPATAPRSKS
nr:MFS transporter [Catenulispora pinisilvae]